MRRVPVLVLASLLVWVLATAHDPADGGDKKEAGGGDKKTPSTDKKIIPGTEALPGKDAGPAKDKLPDPSKGPTPVIRNQYELRALTYADTYVLMRFEKYSGKTWTYTVLKWQEIEETGRVPSGSYDILLVPLPTPLNPRDYRAFRIERETGVTWNLIVNKWEEMKDR